MYQRKWHNYPLPFTIEEDAERHDHTTPPQDYEPIIARTEDASSCAAVVTLLEVLPDSLC